MELEERESGDMLGVPIRFGQVEGRWWEFALWCTVDAFLPTIHNVLVCKSYCNKSHAVGGLKKQKFILSHFWGQGVWIQSQPGCVPCEGSKEASFFACSSFRWLPAVLGLWQHNFIPGIHIHMAIFPLCLYLHPHLCFLIRVLVIAQSPVWPHLNLFLVQRPCLQIRSHTTAWVWIWGWGTLLPSPHSLSNTVINFSVLFLKKHSFSMWKSQGFSFSLVEKGGEMWSGCKYYVVD